MSNISNLKQWKPGQSGNLKGRPIGTKNMSSVVRELLERDTLIDDLTVKRLYQPTPTDVTSSNTSESIGIVMILKALNGDIRAAEWLRKTAYGDKFNVADSTSIVVISESYDQFPRSFITQEESDDLISLTDQTNR